MNEDIRPDEELPIEKKTWKTFSTIPVDVSKLGAMNFKDKVFYLAICGWKMEVEARNNNEYLYAIKYIDRKKRRIYVGKKEDHLDGEYALVSDAEKH